MTGEVRDGMSWRRFSSLVAGLSPDSVWRMWRRQKAGPGGDVPVLEGDALERAVRQIR